MKSIKQSKDEKQHSNKNFNNKEIKTFWILTYLLWVQFCKCLKLSKIKDFVTCKKWTNGLEFLFLNHSMKRFNESIYNK